MDENRIMTYPDWKEAKKTYRKILEKDFHKVLIKNSIIAQELIKNHGWKVTGKAYNSIDGRYTKLNFNTPNGLTDIAIMSKEHFIELADPWWKNFVKTKSFDKYKKLIPKNPKVYYSKENIIKRMEKKK